MAEAYTGEIRMWGGLWAPRLWAFCQGQSVGVEEYDELFALIGTIYGGDGTSTFKLPDLRNRVPISQGQGPGLTNRLIGQAMGETTHTLIAPEAPHTHPLFGSSDSQGRTDAENALLGGVTGGTKLYSSEATTPTTLHPATVQPVGNGQAHNNVMPFQTINFIICLQGIWPSRS